ncbi:antifreeze protein [Rhodobacterales bacterium HKCCE2091]|nr:antifreeze protein [Rhodobacterales bacterium HKCCE2091]
MAPFDPFAPMRLGLSFAAMLTEANMVIAMRVAGMAGLWSVTPSENARMIGEKAAAFTHATIESQKAILRGTEPFTAAERALAPIRKQTRANARRLVRRGPKLR